MKTSKKKFKKKKKLINIFKWKSSINKLKPKTIVINILNNFDKEGLLILAIKKNASTFNTKKVDIAIISINAYYITCKLIKAQVFAIAMKDLEYQAKNRLDQKLIQKVLYQKNIMIF